MPVCGPVAGCPAPLLLAPPPVARKRCPRSVIGCPTSSRVGPWIGCPSPSLAPFTLTRLPVPTPVTPGPNVSSGAVGVPPRCSTRCPAARDPRQAVAPVRRSASPRCSPLPVARSLVASELVASHPVRSRSRLVGRERFPPPAARRPPSKDSVSRPRLACAPRYEAYLRERKTPGQEVFRKTQGYPRTNRTNPQNSSRSSTASYTGLSPAHGLFIPSSSTRRTRRRRRRRIGRSD